MAKYRVMLADDHGMFREGLKSLVGRDPRFSVVGEAKDGKELLDRLKRIKCDLVIVDLSMPNMDGMQAIKVIHKFHPKLKILVLTMMKDHEHFKHAMAYGASGYLLKDDAFDQFLNAIRKVTRGKRFVSQTVESLLTDRYLRTADEEEDPTLEILTKRERQILRSIASGLANKNIAAKLKISIRTVETHRLNLTNKLGIKTTAGLVKFAIAKGVV